MLYHKRKIRSFPLVIRNPFWTTFANLPSLPVHSTVLDLPEPIDMDSPQFFKSVEARDKALEIQRAIERQNAKAYNEKEAELQEILKAEQKRRDDFLHNRIIQYYAENAEEDGVPPEFDEEVTAYYATHPGVREQRAALNARRKEIRDRKQREKYARDMERLQEDSRNWWWGSSGHGWKARPLHTLLRPYKYMEDDPSPKEQVDQQQDAIDARQNLFNRRYEERYGKTPSRETTKEAMPEIAAPVNPSAYKIAQRLNTKHHNL